jgi:hypothetical protein
MLKETYTKKEVIKIVSMTAIAILIISNFCFKSYYGISSNNNVDSGVGNIIIGNGVNDSATLFK